MSDRFKFPRVDIMGVPVHVATMEQALDAIDSAIEDRQRLMIGVVNAAKIVNMGRDVELHRDVTSSDLILADGMAVVLASKVLRRPLPERVTGIDLMFGILERGTRGKYRVFCFGASEDVSRTVAEKIAEDYPGVEVVGRRNGYYDDSEEEAIAAEIASLDVDVLFVAITSPKKERFMAKWGEKLGVTVVHGVGGSFDVYSGKVERAPDAWQKSGFEWLYRVKQEPRRLWRRYLVTNSLFAMKLARFWFAGLWKRA